MNSCILMAEVTQDPQLRYTPDNQTPISEMTVQIAGLRDEDPPATLKVVGWGNLAQEIQEKYHVGDRLIVEGRLNMNRIDRPEGFKETRAELTAQRIHLIGADASLSTASATPASTAATAPASVPAAPASAPKAKPTARTAPPASEPAKTPAYAAKSSPEPVVDYDDIPF
ncbi:MAG TPA: single-stranded DNA-binding protein [Coleofasciculaceae cyanobacterium]